MSKLNSTSILIYESPLETTAVTMAEDKLFDKMSYFMWTVKDIFSTHVLKSPCFTVVDMKFHMLFQQYNGISSISMVPEVGEQQSTVPFYVIETGISILRPYKFLEDFLFIYKTSSYNSTGHKEVHIVWKVDTSKLLDNHYKVVQPDIGRNSVTFLCVFGPLSEYQKESLYSWSESLCVERLRKDLDKLRLNANSSFVIKCGDKTLNAHKVILSARSEKLAAMLRNKKTAKEVVINMKFEVLENLITYIYSGRLKNVRPSAELLIELYENAVEYKIDSLAVMAYCKLIHIMDKEKLSSSSDAMDKRRLTLLAIDLLSMANDNRDEDMKKAIMLLIIRNKGYMLKEKVWKEFRQDNQILAMELYGILDDEESA